MLDGKNFSKQPVRNNVRTYKNIKKIATGQQETIQVVVYWIIHHSKKNIS